MPRSLLQVTPSIAQIQDWYENQERITLYMKQSPIEELLMPRMPNIEPYQYEELGIWRSNEYKSDIKDNSINGIITRYECQPEETHIWLSNEYQNGINEKSFILSDIVAYLPPKLESIFLDEHSENPEKICLQTKDIQGVVDKIFWVDKKLLSERLTLFRNMFNSGMRESYEKIIDVTSLFSSQELAILLSVINTWEEKSFKNLSFEQACILLEVAAKVCDPELESQAKIRKNQCDPELENAEEIKEAQDEYIQTMFFEAVINKNYKGISKWLKEGADIRRASYKLALPEELSPQTPIVFAIKNRQLSLAEHLLKNGADPNSTYTRSIDLSPKCHKLFIAYNCGNSSIPFGEGPGHVRYSLLMDTLKHKELEFVKLLLENGANPNLSSGTLDMDAMEIVFIIMIRAKEVEKNISDMIGLLLSYGYVGKIESVIARIKAAFSLSEEAGNLGMVESFNARLKLELNPSEEKINLFEKLWKGHQESLSTPQSLNSSSLLASHSLFSHVEISNTSSTNSLTEQNVLSRKI